MTDSKVFKHPLQIVVVRVSDVLQMSVNIWVLEAHIAEIHRLQFLSVDLGIAFPVRKVSGRELFELHDVLGESAGLV